MRLTKSFRNSVIKALEDQAFKERQEALKVEFNAIRDAVYAEAIPQEVIEATKKVPKELLNIADSFRVRFGSDWEWFTFDKGSVLPNQSGALAFYDATSSMAKRYFRYNKEMAKLHAERSAAKNKARALLNSVSTLKKLKEVWPEVSDTADSVLGEPKESSLPVSVTSVNRAFGL